MGNNVKYKLRWKVKRKFRIKNLKIQKANGWKWLISENELSVTLLRSSVYQYNEQYEERICIKEKYYRLLKGVCWSTLGWGDFRHKVQIRIKKKCDMHICA